MKRTAIVGLLTWMTFGLTSVAHAEDRNSLSDEEQNSGWRLLFDGKSTAGWRGYKSETVPDSWKVENGSLLSRRDPTARPME